MRIPEKPDVGFQDRANGRMDQAHGLLCFRPFQCRMRQLAVSSNIACGSGSRTLTGAALKDRRLLFEVPKPLEFLQDRFVRFAFFDRRKLLLEHVLHELLR